MLLAVSFILPSKTHALLCSGLYAARGSQAVTGLDKIRSRLSPKIAKYFDFEMLDAFKVVDSSWEPDSRFDDTGPSFIVEPPKNLNDKRIKWVDGSSLEQVVQRGEP